MLAFSWIPAPPANHDRRACPGLASSSLLFAPYTMVQSNSAFLCHYKRLELNLSCAVVSLSPLFPRHFSRFIPLRGFLAQSTENTRRLEDAGSSTFRLNSPFFFLPPLYLLSFVCWSSFLRTTCLILPLFAAPIVSPSRPGAGVRLRVPQEKSLFSREKGFIEEQGLIFQVSHRLSPGGRRVILFLVLPPSLAR